MFSDFWGTCILLLYLRTALSQGLLFNTKLFTSGVLRNPIVGAVRKCPIQKIRTCDWFLNNLRTEGDKDLRFSSLDTRDSGVWKCAQIWLVDLLTNQILAYFNGLIFFWSTFQRKCFKTMTTFYKEDFFNSKLEMGKVVLVPVPPGPRLIFFERDRDRDQFFWPGSGLGLIFFLTETGTRKGWSHPCLLQTNLDLKNIKMPKQKKIEKGMRSECILQHPRSVAYRNHKTIVFDYVKHGILNFPGQRRVLQLVFYRINQYRFEWWKRKFSDVFQSHQWLSRLLFYENGVNINLFKWKFIYTILD
jgi:hypothetical protein